MAEVLIRTPKQWEDYARAKKDDLIKGSDQFFVEHDMAAEFSMWAIRKATLHGFAYGVVSTLFFVVMLGIVVRLFL